MLIAEDLLLLLHDLDDGQDAVLRGDIALTGAVLAELVELGAVGLSEAAGDVEPGRLLVLDRTWPGHSVLADALGHIAAYEGSLPLDVLPEMTGGLRDRLFESLAERDMVRQPEHETYLPTEDATARVAQARAALQSMLRAGQVTDVRSRTLLGLLSGTDLEDAVLDPNDAATDAVELDRREWAVTDGVWIRDEVAKVLLRADTPASGVSPFIRQM